MKGLTEITLLDSTHNLGLRCKLERDLFRVVERLSADTGEATRKETVNAIGLTRRIGKQDGNFRPLVGRIPRLFLQLPSCRLKGSSPSSAAPHGNLLQTTLAAWRN